MFPEEYYPKTYGIVAEACNVAQWGVLSWDGNEMLFGKHWGKCPHPGGAQWQTLFVMMAPISCKEALMLGGTTLRMALLSNDLSLTKFGIIVVTSG